MANLFVQEALPIFLQMMKGRAESGSELATCTLQDFSIEKQRLFRAVYRFIIFGNLFGLSSTDICDNEEPCEYFLCRFTAWQVEEISCIKDFITNKILLKWHEMEDNESSRLAANPEPWEVELHPNNRWETDFFGKQQKLLRRKIITGNLATLSIEDLIAIFEAKGVLLEELVRKRASTYQRVRPPFLEEALDVDPGNISVVIGGDEYRGQVECPVKDMLEFEENNLTSANSCCFWANKWSLGDLYIWSSSPSSMWEPDRTSEGFRRFGYVFLDYSCVESWPDGKYLPPNVPFEYEVN